ncbi:MAG TPA: hypothetical protein VN939_05680 [Chthoniobacterales bacterium]|nr:hypothetical protein [Chthoniobacterales bacterium]
MPKNVSTHGAFQRMLRTIFSPLRRPPLSIALFDVSVFAQRWGFMLILEVEVTSVILAQSAIC